MLDEEELKYPFEIYVHKPLRRPLHASTIAVLDMTHRSSRPYQALSTLTQA